MHFNLKALIVPAVIGVAATAADDAVNHGMKLSFDKSVDGKIELVEKVLVFAPYEPHPGHEVAESGKAGQGVQPSKRGKLDAREALNALLGPRYLTCPQGYGYCSSFGKCCQEDCCSYGYCVGRTQLCCPAGPCDAGTECCNSGCIPADGECCQGGGFCHRGNHCYRDRYSGQRACCTDEYCTKYVDDDGTTVTATTSYSTTTTTYTTYSQYYYYTYTWYYYYYFWTYVEYSVVTSTRTSTSTTLSIYTTAEAAATDWFSSLVSSTSFPTPAAATSLESLAGSTKGPEPTAGPSSSADAGGGNPSVTANSNPSGSSNGNSNGNSNGGSNGNTGGNSNNGGSSSGAMRTFASIDRGVLTFLAIGATIGIVAVAL